MSEQTLLMEHPPLTVRNLVSRLSCFTYHQAMCCVFPAGIFLTLWLSQIIKIPFLARYDFILTVCLFMQWGMVKSGLESKDELKVITLFHLIGLAMEIYKVQMGSWAYPEAALTRVAGVPLYSGFMYASVASYICQAWRRVHLQMVNFPSPSWSLLIALSIYLNFFTNHYIYDFRWGIAAVILMVFARTDVQFRVQQNRYRMPLALSFLLIGFFIWIAENIATFFHAWQYPYQQNGWHLVHIGKVSSWSLLVIVSVIIVAQLKRMKQA